jgi:hypothetical protein
MSQQVNRNIGNASLKRQNCVTITTIGRPLSPSSEALVTDFDTGFNINIVPDVVRPFAQKILSREL